MKEEMKDRIGTINRRSLLGIGLGLAASSVLARSGVARNGQSDQGRGTSPDRVGRRMLGKLEVLAVGLGVQNTSRKYETTVPYLPEMINIIRAAFDRGVTFFDAAEAYGPHEVEQILGEAVAPFRDKVQIATKFGWNIDQKNGRTSTGDEQPTRPNHSCGRQHAQAPAYRPHLSSLPASSR